jgi:hypothetical protein
MASILKDQILEREKEIANDMKLYNNRHCVEKETNYYMASKKSDSDLASYIFDNYKNLDTVNDQELAQVAMKCLTPNQLKSILLEYELRNYKVEEYKEMTLEEFTKEAKFLLNRYQCKAGGFRIEDNEWTLYTSDNMPDSGEYYIKDNELLFVNTVNNCDIESDETDTYLDSLVDRLDRLATNVDVEIRYEKSPKNKPSWLLLWITYNEDTIKVNTDEIVGESSNHHKKNIEISL